MNLFQKIKAFFVLRKLQQEATAMEGPKPGWKTSEFWLTVLGTTLPTLLGTAKGIIPPEWGAIILAVSSAAYGLIRAITKNGAVTSRNESTNVTVKAS